jgi:hypothetical protein
MVLSARPVALYQNRGVKLVGDWFALDVVTKQPQLEVPYSTKRAPLLRLGLKLHGT